MRGWLGGMADLLAAARGSIGLRLQRANRAVAMMVVGALAVGLVGLGFAFVSAIHGDAPDRDEDWAGGVSADDQERNGGGQAPTEPTSATDEVADEADSSASLDAPLAPDDSDGSTTPSSASDDRSAVDPASNPGAGATPATSAGQATRTTTTRPPAASTSTTAPPPTTPTTQPPPDGGSGGLLGGLLEVVDRLL